MPSGKVKRQAQVPRRRQYTGLFFPSYVVLASITLIALALAARRKPYFAVDLQVTRALQSFHPTWFDRLMRFFSQLGYPPQTNILGSLLILLLYGLGLKWEAAMELLLMSGSVALFYGVLWLVKRPRPSADLVKVATRIPSPAFQVDMC